MKHLFIFAALLFLSCDNEDKTGIFSLTSSKIVGAWQLEATRISPGGYVDWSTTDEDIRYDFNIDGTFTYSHREEPGNNRSGFYTVSEGQLNLRYLHEGQEITASFYLSLNSMKMTLQFTGCIEECRQRYTRK